MGWLPFVGQALESVAGKKQIFCAKIWLQAKSEKAAEPRNHQDFGVNQPSHKISASFSVMDS